MDLPAPVIATLSRGIAAYLREAKPSDVPSKLRPISGFRDQALKPHRAKLIAALDDEEFRTKILEWLDDSPPIKGADATALGIAAAREDGWQEDLTGTAARPKKPKKSEAERLRGELAAERRKVAKLKEDLRTQREEARSALRDAKQRSSELAGELRAAKSAERSAETELKAARAETQRMTRATEKEQRSLRREAERATSALAKAEERVTTLKREVAALKRRVNALEEEVQSERAKAQRAAKRRSQSSTGQKVRRKLPVPKGLLEDAPETLRSWLSSDDVKLIVDGYNVGKATNGFPDLELEAMRNRVIEELSKLARRYSVEAIVVFDGAEVAPGTARRRRGQLRIEYSSAETIADDHIVDLVAKLPPHPVVVATNDRELQDRVRQHAATVATSDQLLALIR